ncbi:MAG: integrase [Candidatus Eremiobacteraeota bacterium]|nr:integrase [Candidatus Eremiobacteraeota bacterium]
MQIDRVLLREPYFRSERSPFNQSLLYRIKSIAAVRVRYGYRRIDVFLRREGRRLDAGGPQSYASNGVCQFELTRSGAIDFMHDRLAHQRKIRLLTGVDLYTRECVMLKVAGLPLGRRRTRARSRLP